MLERELVNALDGNMIFAYLSSYVRVVLKNGGEKTSVLPYVCMYVCGYNLRVSIWFRLQARRTIYTHLEQEVF